jgi:uncharacterized protein YdaU (DUF1376 family)
MAEGKRALWWWIDRWRRSSAFIDMTLAEQGAYRNLLDEIRLRGGCIPNDERTLAKACGDPLEWPNVREKVLAKFVLGADGWTNTTATEVNGVSDAWSESQTAKGKARAAGASRQKGRFTSPASRTTSRNTSRNTSRPPAGRPAGVPASVSGSVSVSVSVSGTENGNEPSPAVAGAALAAPSPPEEKPWSVEACDDWEANLGDVASMAGRIGKALKPLLGKHGWGTVRELWQRACAQAAAESDPEYFTPEVFARTFKVRLTAPTPRSRGRPSVGERQLAAAAEFIRGKGGGS